MKETTIENYENSLIISCPCCDNWEEIGYDHPRHKLGSFDLIAWKEDEEGKDEESEMLCLECKEKFNLIWKYEN